MQESGMPQGMVRPDGHGTAASVIVPDVAATSGEDVRRLRLDRMDGVPFWTAFGASAYGLCLYMEADGRALLCGYSEERRLPCAAVGEETVKRLRRTHRIIDELSGRYIVIESPVRYGYSDYLRWTAEMHPAPMFNATAHAGAGASVSGSVPSDRFIPDGMSPFARRAKRAGDCFLSGLALLAFSPLFLACYAAVRMEDGGPAIFRQERIGRYGRPFEIYKFRTMRRDAEASGPQLSHSGGDGDPRLTKVGRFLRAHHLDELPQLWNVFTGDMAFIGPRPERRYYIDRILEHDGRYVYLYQIRPGVTSYATLHNGYTDTMEKMLRRLEYDLYYLCHRSWRFDMKILAKTFLSIVCGRKF